jgi:hypothetical protein
MHDDADPSRLGTMVGGDAAHMVMSVGTSPLSPPRLGLTFTGD